MGFVENNGEAPLLTFTRRDGANYYYSTKADHITGFVTKTNTEKQILQFKRLTNTIIFYSIGAFGRSIILKFTFYEGENRNFLMKYILRELFGRMMILIMINTNNNPLPFVLPSQNH